MDPVSSEEDHTLGIAASCSMRLRSSGRAETLRVSLRIELVRWGAALVGKQVKVLRVHEEVLESDRPCSDWHTGD